MTRHERQAVSSFGVWFATASLVQAAFLPHSGLPSFLIFAGLCALNLGSMGKLFANLAEAVSSVDANRKSKSRAYAILWAIFKAFSLVAIVAALVTVKPEGKFSSVLGLSGWVWVPLFFGVLEMKSRRR